MLAQLVNFMGKALYTPQVNPVKPATSNNPFSNVNPFVSQDTPARYENYGKNKPVRGGFFAGYYNGKANIVGTRLFVEA
ncbi:MAG: hypothetical protein WC197_04045 [Candidatus Gastranaerophilaceae bacterium]|jgi:hypothetical protein